VSARTEPASSEGELPGRPAAGPAGPAPSQAFRRLRRLGEACLWLMVLGVALVAVFWVAGQLRVAVLPIGLALVLATFLHPPAVALRRRGLPGGLAALVVVAGSLLILGGVIAALAPQTIDEFGELDVGLAGGLETIQRWLSEGPLGLEDERIDQGVEQVRQQFEEVGGQIGQGALLGAFILIEIVTALVLAIVLLFFLLKDGERIWAWAVGLTPRGRREDVRELGRRCWDALAGFMRGQAVVAAFDAFFIGLALVILGVPLVLPLVVLTFFGAFVPIIGAFAAGAAAVLVALVAEGFATALILLAVIVVVQQVEGNVLEPVVVGRTVHVHPVAILLGVTVGVTLAGILGALVATPIVAVAGAALGYGRERADAAEAPGGGGQEGREEAEDGSGGSARAVAARS
jgi:putative heme transporter